MKFVNILILASIILTIDLVYGQSSAPNIIIILADDMGWNDIGFHGSNQMPSPNLDALAYSAVILNNHYVQPLCTPSRAALLTGMYPIRLGMSHSVITGGETYGLPLNVTLMPEYLKQKNYATHLVGKWHLGHCQEEYLPTFRGFDSYYGYWLGKQDFYIHTNDEGDGWVGYDMRRNMTVDHGARGHYITDLIDEESVSIILNHDTSNPLFLSVNHAAVHSANENDPLQAPQEIIDMLSYIEDPDRRTYAAMLWKMDESVGHLVEALAQKQMLNNSIILFSSDNGGAPEGYDLNAGSNWPLRGVKAGLYEGGIRAASFIWSPLINDPGRVSQQFFHITDWLPSLLNAAGGGVDFDGIDGIDVWAEVLSGAESPRIELLHNIDPVEIVGAIREGAWKLVNTGRSSLYETWLGPSGRNGTALEENWSYILSNILNSTTANAVLKIMPNAYQDIEEIRSNASVNCGPVPANATAPELCVDPASPCLFNVVDDPCEYYDLSAVETEIYDFLYSKLQAYNETVADSLKTDRFEEAHPKYWNDTWNNWLDYPTPLTTMQPLL